MLKLDYDAAHRFVEGFPNAAWNGWTLELFKPDARAFTKKNGAFRDGRWGFLTRVTPDEQGKYVFRVA